MMKYFRLEPPSSLLLESRSTNNITVKWDTPAVTHSNHRSLSIESVHLIGFCLQISTFHWGSCDLLQLWIFHSWGQDDLQLLQVAWYCGNRGAVHCQGGVYCNSHRQWPGGALGAPSRGLYHQATCPNQLQGGVRNTRDFLVKVSHC